jgi:glutathione peroxidase-family protein
MDDLAVSWLVIICFFVLLGSVIYLLIPSDSSDLNSYCREKYGKGFKVIDSEKQYPKNIRICYKVLSNGEISKYYIDTKKLRWDDE